MLVQQTPFYNTETAQMLPNISTPNKQDARDVSSAVSQSSAKLLEQKKSGQHLMSPEMTEGHKISNQGNYFRKV